MPDILVTGFEPFGGEATNPSWQAVDALPDSIAGAHVHKLEVPVVFGTSGDVVVEAMRRIEPRVVLLVGQAAGRAGLTVERVAINVADATATDNSGVAPSDAPLVEGGPAAYFATLPLKDCVVAARAAGVPASVSNSAGTYVCNQLMYRALHEQATQGKASAMAGFVHVPLSCAQALDRPAMPSLPISSMTEGLLAILHECIARYCA